MPNKRLDTIKFSKYKITFFYLISNSFSYLYNTNNINYCDRILSIWFKKTLSEVLKIVGTFALSLRYVLTDIICQCLLQQLVNIFIDQRCLNESIITYNHLNN